jgi:hypothetical protein
MWGDLMTTVLNLLDGIEQAQQRARASLARATEAAVDLAQLDVELQLATDVLERARLADARRHAAGVHSDAEGRALDAVFALSRLEDAVRRA